MRHKMSVLFFFLFLLISVAYTQVTADDDNDGIPNSEDLCPGTAGSKINNGCPLNTIVFTEADKKLLIKNFLTILTDVKTGFKTIKTGETDWDVSTRQGHSRSTLALFPNHTDNKTETLLFAQYNGKPMNAYEELSPVDVNTVVSVLLPTLKSKGFTEVNTKGMGEGMEGRSFRSKDAVVQIASNSKNGKTTIDIGKFLYYYEKDVVAVGAKKPVVAVPKPAVTPAGKDYPFIEKNSFEEMLETVCENSMHLKIKGKVKPENNKWYETTSALNGTAKSMPVYYLQTSMYRFAVKTGLSNNLNDLDKAAAYINSLLEKTDACWEAYRKFKLKKDEEKGYYTDVYAWDDGGMFVYVEKENGMVQLRLSKINYTSEEKKKAVSSEPATNECSDMATVLKECITSFQNVKGGFVKKSTPNEYYATTLPALGLKSKYVVESISLDVINESMVRKKFTYFTAEENYENKDDALKKYNTLKVWVRKCYSGTANVSDETNQKIYELFTDYKGYKIRIAITYINFFSSSVSISFRIAD